MGEVRELPEIFKDWLSRNRIALDADPAERGSSIWAEWDAHRRQVELGVWVSQACPRCGQTGPAHQSLVVFPGFGDNNWQHGCGEWWSPSRWTVHVGGQSEDEVLADLDDALAYLRKEQEDEVAALRKRLARELRAVLALPEDEREANGSEIEPGVWCNNGKWEAWDYHPNAVEGEYVLVTEADLTGTISS